MSYLPSSDTNLLRNNSNVDLFKRYYEFIWIKGKPLMEQNETGPAAIPLIRDRLATDSYQN